MCGIVGAVAKRPISKILLEGLKHLEYRGYDSAGMAALNPKSGDIECLRTLGKVCQLETALEKTPLTGQTGIAHTRWATHGEPSEINAHPHCSHDTIAVVHNGIIENHQEIREMLEQNHYVFASQTDTEVICHLIHFYQKSQPSLQGAIQRATEQLTGAFALGIIDRTTPNTLYAVCRGSPLVIGIGIEENFIASDSIALLPVTQRFIYLEENDLAVVCAHHYEIFQHGSPVDRAIQITHNSVSSINKGQYRHFMLKEIHEQARALSETVNRYHSDPSSVQPIFGDDAPSVLLTIERIKIVACGTSYHAGLVGAHWLEALASIPCHVEVASEQRYRHNVVEPNTLFVVLSQSGETADTLAALRNAKNTGFYKTLAICNVPQSTITREADFVLLTEAGREIGVAATKTFTTQLAALLMLTQIIAAARSKTIEAQKITSALQHLPGLTNQVLQCEKAIQALAQQFPNKKSALFLGRGIHYPIAMEGALKLKEIAYIHAESYPAGELKHGPLALIDAELPVIILAPNGALLDKLCSNIQEIQARGGVLYIISDAELNFPQDRNMHFIHLPPIPELLAPMLFTIPLQLLSYHIAVTKGTDIDQPRNLAKSVTVE